MREEEFSQIIQDRLGALNLDYWDINTGDEASKGILSLCRKTRSCTRCLISVAESAILHCH